MKAGNYAHHFDEDFNGIILIDTKNFPSHFSIEPEDIQAIASKAADGLYKFVRIILMDADKNVVMFSKDRNVAIINMATPKGLGAKENRISYLPYAMLFKYCSVTVNKFTAADKSAMDKLAKTVPIILTYTDTPNEEEEKRLDDFRNSCLGYVTIVKGDGRRPTNIFQIILNQFEDFFKIIPS